jgi:Zn-dependent protease with chaperone function
MVTPGGSQKPAREATDRPVGPSLTGRAFLSIAFLLGFYVLALGVVGALVAANVATLAVADRLYAQLVIATGVIGFAILRGIFFINRSAGAPVAGVAVDDKSQPELVGVIRSVAEEMGTEPPARIFLVPDVNAFVLQTGGLLGMRPGERVMAVGLPLIEALTVDQLRSVVAHELGHYAGGDTRLGGLTYRAGASIGRTIDNVGHDSLIGKLFDAYGRMYLRLSLRVRRRQELTADAAAVRLAGRENHMTALRRGEVTAYAYDHFLRSYLVPLWERGCDAENAFEGYRSLLADRTRQEELDALEMAVQEGTTDPYDSHPSLAERLAHAQGLPEGPSAGHDPRPARDLLAGAEDLEREVGALLTRELTGTRMDRVVRWDGTAAGEYSSGSREQADVVLRAAAAVAEDPDAANLAAAIVLVEEGCAAEMAAAITGPIDDGTPEQRVALRRRVLTYHLGIAIGCYLVAERGHSWAVSWSGPLALVDAKGNAVDPYAVAESLLDDPASGARLRRSLGGVARLKEFQPSSPGPGQPEEPSQEVVALIPDVGARRKRWDAVATTTAVVLHPIAGGFGWALRIGLSQSQGLHGPANAATRRRIEKLGAMPAEELFGKAAGAVVLPVDGILRIRKRSQSSVELELAGHENPWRLRFRTKGDRDLMLTTVQALMASRLPTVQQHMAA